MFSITTIASSTTMPVARMMPKSVSVLMEKPISLMNANAPTSDTGIVIAGISVLRQLWRKMNITSTTSTIASASVFSTSRIDSSTTSVVLKAIWYFEPGRKCVREPSSSAPDAALDVERVGRGQLHDAEADRVDALEPELRAVGLGAELDACRRPSTGRASRRRRP